MLIVIGVQGICEWYSWCFIWKFTVFMKEFRVVANEVHAGCLLMGFWVSIREIQVV